MIHEDILNYNNSKSTEDKAICDKLLEIIQKQLIGFENKVWHAHPVWFEDGNPIVGYDKLKSGVRLMFWSGASFEEPELKLGSGKFKDASKTYVSIEEINIETIKRWLQKSKEIQWDYKNIVKRKGVLERIK
jgi:hypothetical protein